MAVVKISAILQKYLTFQGGSFMFSWAKTAQNRCFSTLQLLNLINIQVRKGKFWLQNILLWVKIGLTCTITFVRMRKKIHLIQIFVILLCKGLKDCLSWNEGSPFRPVLGEPWPIWPTQALTYAGLACVVSYSRGNWQLRRLSCSYCLETFHVSQLPSQSMI